MKYATVMVGMSLGQSNEARLEIAAQLAERFGARRHRRYRGRTQSAALFYRWSCPHRS